MRIEAALRVENRMEPASSFNTYAKLLDVLPVLHRQRPAFFRDANAEWRAVEASTCVGYPTSRRLTDLPSVVVPSVAPDALLQSLSTNAVASVDFLPVVAKGQLVGQIHVAYTSSMQNDVLLSIAHDLGNVLGAVELAFEDRSFETVIPTLTKGQTLVRRLAEWSTPLRATPDTFVPQDLLDSLRDWLAQLARPSILVIDAPSNLGTLVARRVVLERALTDLVIKERRANEGEEGVIRVRARQRLNQPQLQTQIVRVSPGRRRAAWSDRSQQRIAPGAGADEARKGQEGQGAKHAGL
ncbi:MAG: hypothetical protein HC923_03980 [Myxococcales bacterium]|nr:hypothetical protein [Myxococcales bacterium]